MYTTNLITLWTRCIEGDLRPWANTTLTLSAYFSLHGSLGALGFWRIIYEFSVQADNYFAVAVSINLFFQ